jgi:hypothetical protein
MPSSLTDLRTDGTFAFPQEHAVVLYDQEDLRLSVWNNHDYLFVQAILWKVPENILGKTRLFTHDLAVDRLFGRDCPLKTAGFSILFCYQQEIDS